MSPSRSHPSAPHYLLFRVLPRAIGWSGAVLGLSVVIGWLADIEVLTRLHANFPVMPLGSAAALVLCGLGLVALSHDLQRTTVLLAGCVLLLLTLALLQLLAGGHSDVFPALFGASTGESLIMAAAPLSGFLLIAAALVILMLCRAADACSYIAGVLAVGAIMVSGIVGFGFVVDVRSIFPAIPIPHMALHLVLGHALLGAGLVAVVFGRLARDPLDSLFRWAGVASTLMLLLFSLFLMGVLQHLEQQQLDDEVVNRAEDFTRHLQVSLDERISAIERMALRWENSGGTPKHLWESDATAYMSDLPGGFLGVRWVDPGGIVRWAVPAEGAEEIIGCDLTSEPSRAAALDQAGQARHAIFACVTEHESQRATLVIVRALTIEGRSDGYLVAGFRIEELLRTLTSDMVARGYGLQISCCNTTAFSSTGSPQRAWVVRPVWFDSGDCEWRVEVWPTAELVKLHLTTLPKVILLGGLFISLLVGVVFWLADRSYRRAAEAEAANRAKSEFLANMSHELRTPLNAILGFSQLFGLDSKLSAETREHAREIERAGEHLLSLIGELIDLSRIEAGKLTLSIEPVSVQQVVGEARELVEGMACDSGIELIVADGADRTAAVLADYVRLRQVLINLLTNAIKYNRPGGQARIWYARDNGTVRISVSDTGYGIPEEKQSRIFTPFDRLGAERGKVSGTGIGLVFSRYLVEAMNGRIGFKSRDDEGSIFWVELPAAELSEKDAQPEDAADVVVGSVAEAAVKPTVLYIEDNPMNLRLMRQILAMRPDLELCDAHSAEIGLALIRSKRPVLILMDINLPGMDGYAALRLLRNHPETTGTPVVAISASAMKGDLEHGLAAGFEAYFTKPIDVRKLLDTIARYAPPGKPSTPS